MGAGLGPVDQGKTAKMVITFTGLITADEADRFNEKLNDLLRRFRLNTDGDGFTQGGSGHVNVNTQGGVTAEFG